MSSKLTAAIWDNSAAKGSALLLQLAIAEYADEQNIASPTNANLAAKIRMSVRQVSRLRQALYDMGELEFISGGHTPHDPSTVRITPAGKRVDNLSGVDKMSSRSRVDNLSGVDKMSSLGGLQNGHFSSGSRVDNLSGVDKMSTNSSSRSITIDLPVDPETTTTTAGGVNGRPLAWVSADRLTDCERAAYDALQAAGIDGTAATTVRTFGVRHCINHAAAFLADAENDPALRPAALIWRIHNRPAPSPSSLRGEWRRWWDRYADRAGLLDGDDPAVPAPAAESGPEDAPDPYAGMLPALRALVRDLEITGMARTELDFYFGAAVGRLEDGGDVLRILHPDGARLSYLRDRLGNRIRLSLPAGVRLVVFGEGGAV